MLFAYLSPLCIPFFFWVLGELVPKSIGMQVPEKSLLFAGPIIYGLSRIFYPFLTIGMKLGQRVLSGRSLDVTNEIDMAHTEDEIACLLRPS